MGVLAKSPPNGTVMMLVHMSAFAANPHLYQSVPYNALKDFEAVGLVGELPFVLVCNPDLPFKNFQEIQENETAEALNPQMESLCSASRRHKKAMVM